MLGYIVLACLLAFVCSTYVAFRAPASLQRALDEYARSLAAMTSPGLRDELRARLRDTPLRGMPSAAEIYSNDAITEGSMFRHLAAAYQEALAHERDPHVVTFMYVDAGLGELALELRRRNPPAR